MQVWAAHVSAIIKKDFGAKQSYSKSPENLNMSFSPPPTALGTQLLPTRALGAPSAQAQEALVHQLRSGGRKARRREEITILDCESKK